MPTETPKLKIKKPLGNEIVSRAAFNENWDLVDTNAAAQADLDAHKSNTNNPHQTTAAQVGAAPSSHVGAGGGAHAAATTGSAGFMSGADKTKLDGIQTGAEVNQNAYSTVKVGATDVQANAKTATIELVAGDGVTLTPDANNRKVVIATTPPGPTLTKLTFEVDAPQMTGGEGLVSDSLAWSGQCRRYTQPGSGMAAKVVAYHEYIELRYHSFSAVFRVKSSDNTNANSVVTLKVEKWNGSAWDVLTSISLKGTEFPDTSNYHEFGVPFKHAGATTNKLRFTVVSEAIANLVVSVCSLVVSPAHTALYSLS